MSVLSPDTALVNGQVYTISMKAGVATMVTSVDSLTADLVNSPVVDLATSIQTNKNFSSLYVYDVTFVYTGDGTDSVADVFQEFANALSGWFSSWSFIAASDSAKPGTGSAFNNPPVLPSAGSIWGIAVIALLVVFVMSGGAGFLREVLPSK